MTQVAEPGSARSGAAPTDGSAEAARIHHWIGGRSVEGQSGRNGPVFNPATGALAKQVDFASVEEVDAAVAAAAEAFPAWRATSLSRRTEILFKIRNLVDQHRPRSFWSTGGPEGSASWVRLPSPSVGHVIARD